MSEGPVVYTIGYEGRTPDDFDATLVEVGVTTLIDIRRRAMSRKRGFAKTALAAHLADAGIGYAHYPDLGAPLDVIHLKNQADHGPILAEYERRLPESIDAVNDLLDVIGRETVCLMCFEADPLQCHRSVLTRFLLQRAPMRVTDL
jgi:uncharacterized protein (DUF488 family)